MFRKLFACVIAVVLAGSANIAMATDSRVLFTHKKWEVRVVAFDSGSIKCVAQVNLPGSSLAIWADGVAPARLQFFDRDWELGQSSADVVVRVDSRPKWNLYSANLNQNSVLFDLPNSNDGRRFVNEVRRGRVIRLGNAGGREVGRWSLSGSSAAIGALDDCIGLIRDRQDGNPFD